MNLKKKIKNILHSEEVKRIKKNIKKKIKYIKKYINKNKYLLWMTLPFILMDVFTFIFGLQINYINFRLPEVTSDLIGSRDYDILVADGDGNISLDRSLILKVRNSEFDSQRMGIDYKKNNAASSSTFYMFANIESGNRGIHDSVTQTNIIRINGSNNSITFTGTDFNGTNFNASNNMYVNNNKVYHEGTIFYGSDEPTPVPGMIWLKPLAQTQG